MLVLTPDGDGHVATVYIEPPVGRGDLRFFNDYHRGDFWVGFYDPVADGDSVFDPPVLTVPADLRPGVTWQGVGTFAGSVRHRLDGRVLQVGRRRFVRIAGPAEQRLSHPG